MPEYDLYTEVKCRQCGQMRQKVASFCPHCGHVVEESWWERLLGLFRSEEKPSHERKGGNKAISALLTLGFASYLLYNAIEKESIQSLIIAVMMLIVAIRSWFSGRTQEQHTGQGDQESAMKTEEQKESLPSLPSGKLFCENCGAEVSSGAVVCPKCGMQFAE